MAHSVSLSWAAPESGVVSSYNVKRSTTSGAEVTEASSTSTSFVDSSNLVEGQTYFYEVTAVNAAGESGPSNEVSVVIPFSVPSAPSQLVATVS